MKSPFNTPSLKRGNADAAPAAQTAIDKKAAERAKEKADKAAVKAKEVADKKAAKEKADKEKAEKKAAEEKERKEIEDAQAQDAATPVTNFGDAETAWVALDKIHVAPKDAQARPFDPKDPEYLDKVQFIRSNKTFYQPIILYPKGDTGEFYISDGRNRWEACKQVTKDGIDRSKIEARIYKSWGGTEGLTAGLLANLRAKKMSKLETADALKSLIARPENREKSLRRIAAENGFRAVNTLRNLLGLANLVTNAQKLVARGEIKAAKAYALAQIPVEEQEDWIENAKTLPTSQFVKAALAHVAAGKKGEPTNSATAARRAQTAARAKTATQMEKELKEVREWDAKSKANDAYQAGVIDGILLCMGRKPLWPSEALAGYQVKPAHEITD
jgi:hypothetical protein